MTSAVHPVALTIAGSDSGAGAGIQADLLTFAAHEVYGTTALTCLTAQNPGGVTAIEALPVAFIQEQILQVHRYFKIAALKTGMLYSAGIIAAVADFLRGQRKIPAVVDPVMVATSGVGLLKPDALAAVREQLLSLALLVTPNLDEVGVLLGEKPATAADFAAAGQQLAGTGEQAEPLAATDCQQSVDRADADVERTLDRRPSERVEGATGDGSALFGLERA